MESISWVNLMEPVQVTGENWTGNIIAISQEHLLVDQCTRGNTQSFSESFEVAFLPDKTHPLFGEFSLQQTSEYLVHINSIEGKLQLADLLGLLRKSQHIDLCDKQDVESLDRFTGFSQLNFMPQTLPEMDWEDCDTSSLFLGHKFDLPILITGMTGGIQKGAMINETLAETAVKFNIPMGIGSQRIALENPEHESIFKLKDKFPELFLIGNLGAAQIIGSEGLERCKRAVEMVQANVLAIHINVLQELVQVEGDRNFRGLLHSIGELCRKLPVPVLIKEVGSGVDPITATRLVNLGVCAIDVGGKGGTSWPYIEGLRSKNAETKRLADCYRDWGIPTAYSLSALSLKKLGIPLIATGGIRDGLTVAKACALGANMVGVGLPLLRAALNSVAATEVILENYANELKVCMLATGSRTLTDLQEKLCLANPCEESLKQFIQMQAQNRGRIYE
ncbi:MAG: type 2 isopentenyl-diphosphate Delta-isomerase [Oligoflexales bacterium]